MGCGSTPCSPGNLSFGLVGFTDPESRDIIVRRFSKGRNFSARIDTFNFQAAFTRSNDTLEVSSLTGHVSLLSNYDYEIYFPVANRLYRMTAINEIISEQKHSIFNPKKDLCINEITDLTINNQFTRTVRFNRFYLVK